MSWKRSLGQLWADHREAAVLIGVDAALLTHLDGVVEDDKSIVRSRTEWMARFQKGHRTVTEAMISIARVDARARRVLEQYQLRVGTGMWGMFARIEDELQKPLPAYLLDYVARAQLSAAFLRTLFDGVPRWHDVLSEHLFIMREEGSVEAVCRSTVEVITDVTETTYKPLLWNLTRLVRERFGQPAAADSFRTLGQLRREFHESLIKPHEPIVAFIDDDAIFVRNGSSHGRRALPFDPSTGRITISDRGRVESFEGEQLIHVLHYIVQRTRAMWLAFYKVSGQMDAERDEAVGPVPDPSSPVQSPPFNG